MMPSRSEELNKRSFDSHGAAPKSSAERTALAQDDEGF
jgi:hypothetical protein